MKIRKTLAVGAAAALATTGLTLATASPRRPPSPATTSPPSRRSATTASRPDSGRATSSSSRCTTPSTTTPTSASRPWAEATTSCASPPAAPAYDRGTLQVGTSFAAGKLGWAYPLPADGTARRSPSGAHEEHSE
ncbi:hypothetical protein NKH77_17685 [Streptomyces sp. M19]